MKNAVLATIELEGSNETVSVFYTKKALGDPVITDVRMGNRSVLHLVEHCNLKMKSLRTEVMNVLGGRSFADYQAEALQMLSGRTMKRPVMQ